MSLAILLSMHPFATNAAPSKVSTPTSSPFSYLEPSLAELGDTPSRIVFSGVPLDLTSARFALEILSLSGDDGKYRGKLYRSYREGWNDLGGQRWAMLPVDAVTAYVKDIFDSVSAGIHLTIESDPDLSKKILLSELRQALDEKKASTLPATYSMASAFLDDALTIGLPSRSSKASLVSAFYADPVRSSPIGYWTWTPELRRIFIQARFLQTSFSFDGKSPGILDNNGEIFTVFQSMLGANPVALNIYKFHAAIEQKLNNPFDAASLLSLQKRTGAWAFLPATRSNETELQVKLAQKGNPLVDPMEEIVKGLRSGSLSFAVKNDSGYYDYQQHALEAILLADKQPEATKVRFSQRYIRRLEEAFKSGMTKTRESHVASSAITIGVTSPRPEPIQVAPYLPIEPLPSAYSRYAEGFHYLMGNLPELQGKRRVQSFDPDEASQLIWSRLNEARKACYGLSLLAADEIGLAREKVNHFRDIEPSHALIAAKKWLKGALESRHLSRDSRFAAPVSVDPFDAQPRMIHLWGTAGLQVLKVEVRFLKEPEMTADNVSFGPAVYYLLADKFVSFKVPFSKGPPSRDQFRRVLDQSSSLEVAMTHLEKGEY